MNRTDKIDTLAKFRSLIGTDILNECRYLLDSEPLTAKRPCDIVIGKAIENLLYYDYACKKYFSLAPTLFLKYADKGHKNGYLYKDTREIVTDAIVFLAFDTTLYNILRKKYKELRAEWYSENMADALAS